MNAECKLSQYADDTTMILDGSKPSFTRAISVLDEFALVSGLKVNYEKQNAFGSELDVFPQMFISQENQSNGLWKKLLHLEFVFQLLVSLRKVIS